MYQTQEHTGLIRSYLLLMFSGIFMHPSALKYLTHRDITSQWSKQSNMSTVTSRLSATLVINAISAVDCRWAGLTVVDASCCTVAQAELID